MTVFVLTDNGFHLIVCYVSGLRVNVVLLPYYLPGDDELLCSVRGSDACYHSECAKEAVGSSTLKRFKCPLHVGF